MKSNGFRAQGTIEYLVIVSIVVILLLVIAYLFFNVFQNGLGEDSLSSAQNVNYWNNQSVGLTDAIMDENGDAVFVLRNNTEYPLNLIGYKLGENEYTIENGILFNPNEKKSVFFPEANSCNGTNTCSFDKIVFYYTPVGLSKSLLSGGASLVVEKKDSVTWTLAGGTNPYVCVAAGELSVCENISSGDDTNTQTAGWTDADGNWLTNINTNDNNISTNFLKVNSVLNDSNNLWGIVHCPDGNIIVGYVEGFTC